MIMQSNYALVYRFCFCFRFGFSFRIHFNGPLIVHSWSCPHACSGANYYTVNRGDTLAPLGRGSCRSFQT